ncbi:MAG: ABC transporter ATP-binding protein [Leptospirales bacterium]|nr:ABC transporter ATP-binding protein [Leptospirales bacterium]
MKQETALAISGLKKTYANGVEALRNLDLEVRAGDFFGLLGPNGAGKTTIIGIISSLVRPSGGRASIFGHDIERDWSQARMGLGVVPQEFNFNIFESVEQIVTTQAGFYGIPRRVAQVQTESLLRRLSLWDKRQTPAGQLSGGMKRRLLIARALVHQPRLLVLDEPTAGVDVELRRSMWEFLTELNAGGVAIILTTHYLEEAEQLCRNVAIIDHGAIVAQSAVRDLIQTMNSETFVLDLAESIGAVPNIEGFQLRRTAEGMLEAEAPRGRSLNDLFEGLSKEGIRVVSMRNKVNRLEELFVRLTARTEAVGL